MKRFGFALMLGLLALGLMAQFPVYNIHSEKMFTTTWDSIHVALIGKQVRVDCEWVTGTDSLLIATNDDTTAAKMRSLSPSTTKYFEAGGVKYLKVKAANDSVFVKLDVSY